MIQRVVLLLTPPPPLQGNKQASLESQQKLEAGRKALCASTGLLESDCEFLETLYKKNAGISASINLYGEYGYDPKVSRWTPDGFATYMVRSDSSAPDCKPTLTRPSLRLCSTGGPPGNRKGDV